MAEAWRARLLGEAGVTKPVLIKKVLSEYTTDEAFIAMFISEARISATLSHGNIAQVYDFGRTDGDYFLAMEYVDGQPLNRIIKCAQRLGLSAIPVPLACFIVAEICRGLHYAHTRKDGSGNPLGIVHRDISPDNVLVSYEGQVKIVDFGIAKAREMREFKTEPGIVKGKFLFFSPEQAMGEEVDARTDVWATGVVLYQLLCGTLPIEGPQHLALTRLIRGEFPPPRELNPALPPELSDIVMRALCVEREQRFESCDAFEDALVGFLNTLSSRVSSTSLSHFVQEMFREDLTREGKVVQVPASFLEQLARWKGSAALTISMRSPVSLMTTPVKPTVRSSPLTLVPSSLPATVPSSVTTAASAPSFSKRSALIWGVGAGVVVSGLFLAIALMVLGKPRTPLDTQPPQSPPASQKPSPPPPSTPAQTVPSQPSTAVVQAPPDKTEQPSEPAAPAANVAAASPSQEELKTQHPAPSAKPSTAPSRASKAEALREEADKAIDEKNFLAAANLSEKCIQFAPMNPECHLLSGAAHAGLGQAGKAVERYRSFLKLAPKHKLAAEVTENLKLLEARLAKDARQLYKDARQLYNEKKYPEALSLAERCLSLESKNADCHMVAGAAYSFLGQLDKTVRHYQTFLSLAPNHKLAPAIREKLEQQASKKGSDTPQP